MVANIAEIARWIDGDVDGDGSIEITNLAKIEEASTGDLSFIANPKYTSYISETDASAVIVATDFPQVDKTVIRSEDPYFAFLKVAQRFHGVIETVMLGIHPTAVVGEGTQLGDDVGIGPLVVLGRDCHIGNRVHIHPGVVIEDHVVVDDDTRLYANVCVREKCRIGKRVIIHCGAVIGSDGFGFAFKEGKYHKLPQMGIVMVEDDVEIGANTTVDRATMGETVIRKGAKLDNLIQVAHNVEIGEHAGIAAQTGFSGSTKIGKLTRIGGQVGCVGHIKIGDRAALGAQAGVTKSVPEGAFYSGYPARPHMRAKREEASLAKLPELLKKVRRLEEEVIQLRADLAAKE
jgi:UDP-3-O-[3-hydroxymyristoyl] glucosamine N-acyltransferase